MVRNPLIAAPPFIPDPDPGAGPASPTDSDGSQNGRDTVPPQVRHSSQAITSQTAINGGSHDPDPRTFAPPSGLSIHQSETSRSALSTPRHSVHNPGSHPSQPLSLADHYNLPLQPPKPWKSTTRTWTRPQLERERYEFFETRVTGRKEVWSGLKQAIGCLHEGDLDDAQGILDALVVTLPTGRLEDGAYDEFGNLYRMPEAVISDPINVSEDAGDMDSQTVLGAGDIDTLAKLEAAEAGPTSFNKEDTDGEKAKEAKGKAVVERDAMRVKCRLSDRGGPDVVVLLGKGQRVAALTQRIRDETEVPSQARIRIAYLGKILDDRRTLAAQGWKEGHVVNALVVGMFP
ncbi:hypothetical protein A1O3_09599 [Capronia epimyces CBS 606.96]|uniref:Ubiquitin-like domain-containing protein n=1 Tax=Capronia epimyces CBS 606.96 TaxID=1182542 RepID=W9XAY7_9EURO|nr:uncharacterized protein A1O3_09599 [Capronia epimyces CBS 606.96]EXJ77373.1 hypothetical protein A1O3_09599 [Capronia epimyces CBS 606.96]